MRQKQPGFMIMVVLGGLLLAILFIPGAQHAIDKLFTPLRVVTYPQRTVNINTSSETSADSEGKLQIISYGSDIAHREIIVDIQDDDVAVGDAVLSNMILVGEVAEVSSGRARVILINDPGFRVIAQTKSGAKGLVSANYNQIVLSDVAQNQRLVPGDVVTTLNSQYSNVGQVAIGVVDEVISSQGLLQSSLLIQSVELDNLSRVDIP